MSFENKLRTTDVLADSEASFFIERPLTSPAFTDVYTGLPLPILPLDGGTFSDQHHAFFSDYKEDYSGESGRVLRHSRLQYGPRRWHARYHDFFDGVSLPADPHARFGMAILACAGFIPDTAVDVRGRKPTEVALTPEEKRMLQEENIIYTEKRISSLTGRDMNNLNRGVYFMKYALSQDLDHVKRTTLEEFVETSNRARRLELGMFIVNKAFLRAVEPVEDLYRAAHKNGNIHPGQSRHPVSYLNQVVDGYKQDYLDELARRIPA